MLVGLALAAVAFIGIVAILGGGGGPTGGGGPGASPTPVDVPVVVATVDIPLGAQIRADQITQQTIKSDQKAADAFSDATVVVGQIARTNIVTGQQITASMFALGGNETDIAKDVPRGLRAQSVQVDQVTGVGTLIHKGDHVDAVVGFGGASSGDGQPGHACGREFVSTVIDKTTGLPQPVQGIGDNTVKVLIQNLIVVGTLLPPPTTTTTSGQPAPSAPPTTTTTLNGQQEIVIVAGTAPQTEIIKYSQINGCISLVLRSPKDYVDATTGQPVEPVLDGTTGIVMKTLVDDWGVLPPQIIEALLPKK